MRPVRDGRIDKNKILVCEVRMNEINQWSQRMKIQRKQKDDFFKNNFQSPIPAADLNKFVGLDYFEPDNNFRFELEFDEYDKKMPIKVEDSAGNIRDMLIWGEFHFKIGNKEYTLQAYKSESGEERLFVPYKDQTNTKETYGAGKYLDLYYNEDRTIDGKWILDFNKATNPWCAYSENYACPFVPPTNWLKVEIKAGEKNYPLAKH